MCIDPPIDDEGSRSMDDWSPYADALIGDLIGKDVLAPGWRSAFEATPRHLFVPAFYAPDHELVTGDDEIQRPEWLAAVYSDETLAIQLKAAHGVGPLRPTSSSTRPGLMARMLDLLDVRDGHRVMEIGTGSGYNCALLCHRLGDAQVSSIDIDPALVDAARIRLADAGYRPTLSAGDGIDGMPERAPFDRIIATCGVAAIPAAWINQLDEGGAIVADVRGELASSLIVAHKIDKDAVQGRFRSIPDHVIWMRAAVDSPLRSGGTLMTTFDFTDPYAAACTIPLAAFDDPDFRFILQLAVPRLGPIGHIVCDGRDGIFLIGDNDTSWVEIDPGRGKEAVLYGGPRRLWPAIADAWARFTDAGRPQRHRLGLTAYEDGRQHVWLDRDDTVILMVLPTAAA
jgi:protein-L-isoaspartate(D-aspartate) O-methyltransferase